MPIQTNLTASPYFDDQDIAFQQDYYKILFRPGAAVQVRELNQLQTLLQRQIQIFGEQVIRTGGIVDGCEAKYHTAVPYVKILDTTLEGAAVDVDEFDSLLVQNEATGLKAKIIKTISGFESQDPNLNTLYLEYQDGGTYNSTDTDDEGHDLFTAGDVLKVYYEDLRVDNIKINVANQGFSNSDTVVILSALEVVNTTGGVEFSPDWVVGTTIEQETTGARAIITAIDTDINDGENVVLKIKPIAAQLALANDDSWAFERTEGETTYAIQAILAADGTTPISGAEGYIEDFAGGGASASISTSSAGEIQFITMDTGGVGYYVLPHVTISTSSATEDQINTIDLVPENFYTKVTVAGAEFNAEGTTPVGEGYAMEIEAGYIFQKGYFLQVDPQYEIVSKYSNTPGDLSVGFTTVETIANSNIDSSLLDNAAGFLNENAPGAHRLVLTPKLTVVEDGDEDDVEDYFAIWKFSDGKVFQQRSTTEFTDVGDEMARRTFEESGNYTLDEFKATTRSEPDFAETANSFQYVIDPGHAYINGYRVKTDANYFVSAPKAKDIVKNGTQTKPLSLDMFYGNYVVCNDFIGHIDTTDCPLIELHKNQLNYTRRDVPPDTLSGDFPASTRIGTARVRACVYEGGAYAGQPGGAWRLYLFDIRMKKGFNFSRARSFYSSSGTGAAGDFRLERAEGNQGQTISADGTVTYAYGAVLQDAGARSGLIDLDFPLALCNLTQYKYRAQTTGVAFDATGATATDAITNDPNAKFAYVGALSSIEETQVTVVPEQDWEATDLKPGTISSVDYSTYAGSPTFYATITGASTNFTTELQPGDYIKEVSTGSIARVISIESDTVIRVTLGEVFDAGAPQTYRLVYPKHIPIPLNNSSSRTVVINGTQTGMTVDVDAFPNDGGITTVSPTATVSYEQILPNLNGADSIVPVRSRFVQIDISSNFDGIKGPWCLGVPNVFRIRGVWKNTGSAATTSSTNVLRHFYGDINHTDEYIGLSWLYKDPNSKLQINSNDFLLVEFDAYQINGVYGPIGGVRTVSSYPIDDTLEFDDLGSNIHTLEIPEFETDSGKYFDLRECIDFRPVVANTAAPGATEGAAPINPKQYGFGTSANTTHEPESSKFNGAGNLKIPVPESDVFYYIEYYQDREDSFCVQGDGEFRYVEGEKLTQPVGNEVVLFTADIPAYPSLPQSQSEEMIEITKINMGHEGTGTRKALHTVRIDFVDEQIPGYTMEEIHKLEKRIEVLEYYVQLSETENEIKGKNMPSSVDSTLERFKFGFFVDDFTTAEFTNVSDPAHDSSIFEMKLAPARRSFNIRLRLDTDDSTNYLRNGRVTFPWTCVTGKISQMNATEGPVLLPVPAPPPPPPPRTKPLTGGVTPTPGPTGPTNGTGTGGGSTVPNPKVPVAPRVVSTQPLFRNTFKKRCIRIDNPNNSEYNRQAWKTPNDYSKFVKSERKIVCADSTDVNGQLMQLNFHVYGGVDRIMVFQGTSATTSKQTLLFTSQTRDPQNLTVADKNAVNVTKYKTSDGKTIILGTNTPNWSRPSGENNFWLINAGKFVWKHDRSKGKYYTIWIVKGTPYGFAEICYPGAFREQINLSAAPVVKQPKVTTPVPKTTPCNQIQVMKDAFKGINLRSTGSNILNAVGGSVTQGFGVTISGQNRLLYNSSYTNSALNKRIQELVAKGQGTISNSIGVVKAFTFTGPNCPSVTPVPPNTPKPKVTPVTAPNTFTTNWFGSRYSLVWEKGKVVGTKSNQFVNKTFAGTIMAPKAAGLFAATSKAATPPAGKPMAWFGGGGIMNAWQPATLKHPALRKPTIKKPPKPPAPTTGIAGGWNFMLGRKAAPYIPAARVQPAPKPPVSTKAAPVLPKPLRPFGFATMGGNSAAQKVNRLKSAKTIAPKTNKLQQAAAKTYTGVGAFGAIAAKIRALRLRK